MKCGKGFEIVSLIEDIETTLIDKLQSALPELTVEAFPDNPAEYEFIHPLGAVLVQYESTRFDGDYALAFTVQPATITFAVVSLTRSLRSHSGCYDVLERIRNAILGLKIPGLEQVKQTDERFSAEEDGVWSYLQTFAVKALVLQQPPNYHAQDPYYDGQEDT